MLGEAMPDKYTPAMATKKNVDLIEKVSAVTRQLRGIANPIVQAANASAALLAECDEGAEKCKTEQLYPAIDDVATAINALDAGAKSVAVAAWSRVATAIGIQTSKAISSAIADLPDESRADVEAAWSQVATAIGLALAE